MTVATQAKPKPIRMTRLQEQSLPQAKRQMVGVRGTEGEERQQNVGAHWYLFRMIDRNWKVVETGTWSAAELAFEK
jgi:hypothetical protein